MRQRLRTVELHSTDKPGAVPTRTEKGKMPRKLDESRNLQQRAETLIPGGVNSPVRAFKAVECDPPFMVRGQGSHIWDADGNEYVDYVGSWGPLILGHADPGVLDAILNAAGNGSRFALGKSRLWRGNPRHSRLRGRARRSQPVHDRAAIQRC